MKKSVRGFLVAMFAAGLLVTTGCDKHQERFEDPPWLGGSSIETLEERGNYTVFLKLMDMANYTEPITKQLFTLFVPDDDAFAEYFASVGKSSVEDLTEDEAVQLFTLHVLRNPRSRYYLIYEYAWSELQKPTAEYASLFHRKETPSTSTPYKEIVRYVPGQEGEELTIYTGSKNVPLWTTEFFGDFGGALDGTDYLFMYPGSTWELNYTPNLKGMNWHNAMVIPNPEIPNELEVRTSSGFIYFLDRVVPPMPSMEEYMIAHQDKYGVYYDLLQRFADYTGLKVDENREVMYRKTYTDVYDLAEERGPSTNTVVPPQNMWTAFLPSNQLMQDYLDNTVLQSYPSIDSVPRVTLFYILQTQLSGALVLKSKLANGYFNAFGDPTDLIAEDLIGGYMCSNGVIYDSKRVLEPNVFITVPGILFFDKDYSTLLYVLKTANMLGVVSNPDADVTLFASTNEQLENYGIRYNETDNQVEFFGPVDKKWVKMNSTELVTFAQDQIFVGNMSDFSGEGYIELNSANYLYYNNNQLGAAENLIKDQVAGIITIEKNDLNGYLAKVNKPIQSRILMGQILAFYDSDSARDYSDPEFSEFAKILYDLRLMSKYKDSSTKEILPNLKIIASSDYWTALIPTNAAIEQARLDGILPVDTDSLESFVKYHFIRDNVIFDDGMKSGTFKTDYTYTDTLDNSTVYGTIKVMNSPGNLSVQDNSGQVITIDHADANVLARKGVVHKIHTVLRYTDQ